MSRRVVITGMGAVTPVGNNVNDFWSSIKNGVSGIDFIKSFDTTDFKVKIAAEVKDFDPTLYVQKKELKRNDMVSIYGIAAATQAVEDSGLNLDEINKERLGVIVGSGIGGMVTIQEQVGKLYEKGPSKVSPLFIPMAISNMVAGNIAIKFGAQGVCENVVTACASGTNCIGDAFRSIKHGYSDIIIAGGAEAAISEIGVAGFTNLTALSTNPDPKKACRPFDKDRDGFVMGDGSGIVILEELEHALKRGAKIYGEVVGYGATGDAYHMTAPSSDGSGAGRAMKLAMEEAEITPSDVSYINAHGTSTPANETSEIKAINYALGDVAPNVPVSSTKSMTGHLLGAAGAIEAIVCVKALEEGFIPPTLNVDEKDENCNFDCVPYVGRSADLKYALSNSLGFGGHNAVLCFKKWEAK